MKISTKLTNRFLTWLMLAVALGAAGYFYSQNQDLRNHPEKVSQQEVAALVATVGRLIELPQGEQPQLATVTDAAKLKTEQTFFANAENGDKVLIYNQAKKAILFRPATKKIIEIGPVTASEFLPTATPSPTVTAQPAASVTAEPSPTPLSLNLVLLNGTSIVGLTSASEAKLAESAPELKIVSKDPAKKSDYLKTVVVDITNHPAAAAQVATIVGGSVGSLPNGEEAPAGADLVVIVGADQQP